MNKSHFQFLSTIILLVLFASCNQCNKPKEDNTNNKVAQPVSVNPPAFSSDSAYQYTQAQVDFGPRNMNSKGHDACGKWLIAKLKLYADTVYVQNFDVTGFDGVILKSTNIIASFNPGATPRILLTSHWDSRPWADQDKIDRDKPILSACDGASGVATLIEMARDIKSKHLSIGIDLFMNDAEDYGYDPTLDDIVKKVVNKENSFCLGAQYWANHPHVPGYKADFGVLLDMAAAHNAVFTREEVSSVNASWVLDRVWGNAAQLGYSIFFSNQMTPAITDDHYYINDIIKVPTIDIIQYDPNSRSRVFANYWHTHNDNMSVIDKNTLDAVGNTLLYTIYQYDAEHKGTVQK